MAATIVPVRGFVKPGEPVQIQFLQPVAGKADDAKKAIDAVGLSATKLPGLFVTATAGEIVENGKPAFAVSTLEGTKLEASTEKIDESKPVDVAAVYPKIKEAGTYVLTWKDAQPLVIQVLKPSIPWGGLKNDYVPAEIKRQFQGMAAQLKASEPIAIHIVPLSCAVISTDKGEIKAVFDYASAPHTVENFISLANQGYYTDTTFHRVMKGFMIQGGDSLGKTERAGTGGPGYMQNAEFSEKKHVPGVLSMARTGYDVNTAGGQFFIVHGDANFLDGAYTVFGKVIEGMDAVNKIAETPVSDKNGTVKGERPKMVDVRIVPATAEQYGIKK